MLASLAVMAPARSAASNARMTGSAMAGWPLASLVTRVQAPTRSSDLPWISTEPLHSRLVQQEEAPGNQS